MRAKALLQDKALSTYLRNPLAVSPHGRMPGMSLRGQDADTIARYLVSKRVHNIVFSHYYGTPILNALSVGRPARAHA